VNSNLSTRYVSFDSRFDSLIRPDAELRQLWTGGLWTEGPVYFNENQSVIWSDIPNNRLLHWSEAEGARVWRSPSNFENGHYRDHQGRMLSCEHGRRCVSRTEPDGSVTILVNSYKGKRLNSPNDLVVKSDGTIWFTDPPYGILSNYEGYQADSELGDHYVFRFDPTSGELDILSDLAVYPNGLAFSPDESLLYVSDTGHSHHPDCGRHIIVFAVENGRTLANGRVFAIIDPGMSDGFRVDEHGNVFTSSGDSVQVFAPDGTRLGKIMVPEKISNLTFGGPGKQTLFITASTSLYQLEVNTRGVQ
jgi:gluconolactonase